MSSAGGLLSLWKSASHGRTSASSSACSPLNVPCKPRPEAQIAGQLASHASHFLSLIRQYRNKKRKMSADLLVAAVHSEPTEANLVHCWMSGHRKKIQGPNASRGTWSTRGLYAHGSISGISRMSNDRQLFFEIQASEQDLDFH